MSQFGQSCGRQVAEQAGQDKGERGDEGPARTAVSLRTRAGLVRTRALVVLVLGAVVEDAFDQTHAGGRVHQALGGAQTLLVTDPAGGKAAGQRALSTATLPTCLAHHKVLLLRRRGGDQRLSVPDARTRSSTRLQVKRFGGRGAGRAEAFGAADGVEHAVGQVGVVVHHGGGGCVVQQPLV